MLCSGCPSMSLDSFLSSVVADRPGGRFPLSGLFELTPHCNLHCVHCYIANCEWGPGVLTLKEVRRLLDELADEGCLFLVLTGGEPLLRPDFRDIYDYAKRKGFVTIVFTNGTLIDRALAEHLAEWPPRDVEITLYGASPETYRRATGSAEAFARCITGVELLQKLGVPFRLKTVVTALSVNDLADMAALARQLGVKFRFDPMINSGLHSSVTVCHLRLSPDDVVKLDREDSVRSEAWYEISRCSSHSWNTDGKEITCGAGMREFTIDAFGFLHPCVLLRDRGLDLKNGSFKSGFYTFMPEALSGKRKRDTACANCLDRLFCNVCAGWAYLETGEARETPIPYLCRIARLRSQVFGQVATGCVQD